MLQTGLACESLCRRSCRTLRSGGAVAKNVERCDAKGVTGNLEGEGLMLGGVWAISSSGDIAYEHKEKVWGDTVEGAQLQQLKAAVASFSSGPPSEHDPHS